MVQMPFFVHIESCDLIPDKNTLKPNKTQERKVLIAIKVDSLCSGIFFSTLVVSSSSRFRKCVSLSTDTFPYEEQEILIIKSKTLKNTYKKKKVANATRDHLLENKAYVIRACKRGSTSTSERLISIFFVKSLAVDLSMYT